MSFSIANGIIQVYDGSVLYIDKWQFSPNGSAPWSDTFAAGTDKYARIRLCGQTSYGTAFRLVADDFNDVCATVRITTDGLEIQDAADTWWRLTVDTSGNLSTTEVV